MDNANARFTETGKIVPCVLPVDLHTAGTLENPGPWIDLEFFDRACFVAILDAGTTADNPIITLMQAQDVSGTNPKALNFTDVFENTGTLTTSDTLTDVTQAASNTYQSSTGADSGKQRQYQIEIKASDLDATNGYHTAQMTISSPGSSALGTGLCLLYGARYGSDVAHMPSALT